MRGLARIRPSLHLHGRRHPWLRVLGNAVVGFWKDNAPGMAGMIAFFGFLALIPLVILVLAFAADVLGGLVSPDQVRRLFQSFVPGLTEHEYLQTYWYPIRRSHVATTILGAGSLVLGTLGLHDSVDWAVNRIWRSEFSRPFWIAKLRGLSVVMWLVGFVLLSLALASVWAVVLGPLSGTPLAVTGWLALLPAFMVDFAVFAALYKLTPIANVSVVAAVIGGAVGAVLWDSSKIIFGWWVIQVGTYNRVYGPLAASVIVMLWLWISGMTFLFGAEVSAAIQRVYELDPEP